VRVRSDAPVFRPGSAAPLRLDNEPDDIHSDGVQVYLRPGDAGPVYGFLIVPDLEDGGVRVGGVRGTEGREEQVRGGWERTDDGYTLTVGFALPDWDPRPGDVLGFDLLVNRMEPDRVRRAGQLAWSGGGGWVYLRGDRQDPAGFGFLELR
jgi:hypothetical protein